MYEEYHALREEIESDIVSVCTPPHTHADIVVDSAAAGSVEAIHCEKPMDRRWADCEQMVAATNEAGVNLTINHQRRFGAPYRTTECLLNDGEIGDLKRVEMPASAICLTPVSQRSGGQCSGK